MSKRKAGKSKKSRVKESDLPQVPLALKDRALSVAVEGITIADIRQPDQPLIYANDGFERLTLYPVADVIGNNCRFLQGPDTDPSIVDEIRNAIHERKECTVEILNYRKDGKSFWNRLSLSPVRDESGETTHYIGVQSDVTARRRAEEALRKANRDLEIANLQMKRDLEAAAKIQRALLPTTLPKSERFSFSWLFQPSEELAGDTLNVFKLGRNQIAFYTLDVSGHGVPAALLSVTLSRWLSPASGNSVVFKPGPDPQSGMQIVRPKEVAETLNRQFPMDLQTAQYFTLLYGILDTDSGRLTYICAGSPPLVHAPKAQKSHFEIFPGYPIGIVDEPDYQEHTLSLEPGDRIFLYTDGLTDAMNPSEDDFGMDRLVESIDESRTLPLDQTLPAIMKKVEDWVGETGIHDDATILGIEFQD